MWPGFVVYQFRQREAGGRKYRSIVSMLLGPFEVAHSIAIAKIKKTQQGYSGLKSGYDRR